MIKENMYKVLSGVEAKNPLKENLILVIGDTHGDMNTMLQPLVKTGIIKVVPDRTSENSYRMEQGPYKDNFRRVIFLGDYVDRGDFSLENMKNVIKLDKLFNEENGKTTTGEKSRQDFMRFLCGNHDVFTEYIEGESYIREYKKIYPKTIQDFQKRLSVMHIEQLENGQQLCFTHSTCLKSTKKAADTNDGNIKLTSKNIPVNLLNKGEIPRLEKKIHMRFLWKSLINSASVEKEIGKSLVFPLFWKRENCEKCSSIKNDDLIDTEQDNSLFIHGHTIVKSTCDNTKSERDKYEDRCRRSLTRLKENHMTSIDFGNSYGINKINSEKGAISNSSYMVFDQEGHYYIEGSSLTEGTRKIGEYHITDFPQVSDDMVQVAERYEENAQMAEQEYSIEPKNMLNDNTSKESNKGTHQTVETREESSSDLAFDLGEYSEYLRDNINTSKNQKDQDIQPKNSSPEKTMSIRDIYLYTDVTINSDNKKEDEQVPHMDFDNSTTTSETTNLLNEDKEAKNGNSSSYDSFDDLINSSETTSLLHSAESDDKLFCGIKTMSKVSTDTKKAQSPRSFKNYFRCCLGREE